MLDPRFHLVTHVCQLADPGPMIIVSGTLRALARPTAFAVGSNFGDVLQRKGKAAHRISRDRCESQRSKLVPGVDSLPWVSDVTRVELSCSASGTPPFVIPESDYAPFPGQSRPLAQPASVAKASGPTGKEIRLPDWKGMGVMTRETSVACRCLNCSARWAIEGALANTIASKQGLSARLIRSGTRLEQFGATFTPGAGNRRIAAGNEAERQQTELASLYRLAACVECGSISVALTKS